MKYKKNIWIYGYLEQVDIEKLDAFEKRLGNISLADIADRRMYKIISQLSENQLELLEKHFPELVKRVPITIALMSESTLLLDKNKERYFQGNWESAVSNILFLDYIQSVNIEEFHDKNRLMNFLKVLDWIKTNIGKLPVIVGIDRLCSELEVLSFYKANGEDERVLLSKLRKLTGVYDLNIGNIDDYKEEAIAQLNFQNYEKVLFEIGDFICKSNNLIRVLENCEIQKLELKNCEEILRDHNISHLLQAVSYDDKLQRKMYEFLKKYNGLQKMYSELNEKETKSGAYSVLLEEYFKEPEECDEKI